MKSRKILCSDGRNHHNCFVCALNPSQYLGNYIGIFSMDGHCKHKEKSVRNSYFAISKLKIISGWFTFAILLSFFAIYITIILSESVKKLPILQMIAETLYCSLCSCLIFLSLAKMENHVILVNDWVNVVHKSKVYGINTLLTKRDVKWLKKKACLMASTIVTSTAVFTIILCANEIDHNIAINAFRKMACLLVTYVQLVVVYQFNVYQLFLECVLLRFQEIVVSHLNVRNPSNIYAGIRTDYKELQFSRDFKTQFKLFSRFYNAVMLNVKYFNALINPSALLWFTCVLAILIINVYLLIKGIGFGHERNDSALLEISTTLIIIGLVYVIKSAHSNIVVCDRICSLLYRFPISKLRVEEADQVENLINHITTQKPKLSACGVFIISIKLLASISGTVVTYVLVALQFRPSWEMPDQ